MLLCVMWYRSIRYVEAIEGFSESGDFVSILFANGGVAFTGGPNLLALLRVTNWGNFDDEHTIKLNEYYSIAKSMGQSLGQIPLRLNQPQLKLSCLSRNWNFPSRVLA